MPQSIKSSIIIVNAPTTALLPPGSWQPLLMLIIVQFLLIIEAWPGQVAPDGIDHEEQESQH